jgi:putative sterol carrier protein|tara:strand:+ start:277 stop:567 length:291 start_codon:yes stop_codon:yes gene_type:complete
LNTELIKDIEKVIDNLKLSNKKNLSNIFLQIKDNENNEIINLDTGLIEKNNINKKSNLIIKMTLETFNSIKNNKKNPEDLLFEEKIKISGDINLLQ